MIERLCNLFEECQTPDAPLCPIQENTIKYGIWYPDEPICRAKKFQNLSWIKKQKQIAKLKLSTDGGFFTVRMLNELHSIPQHLKGADPADYDAEAKWIETRTERRKKISSPRLSKKAVNIEYTKAGMLF